jgi:hypothetical protein
MLEPLNDLPDGVLGFRAAGKLHAADYRDVLLPAIDRTIEAGDEVRIVLVFPSFDGLSGGAAWLDLKMGIQHLTRWKKIALVTDVEWMQHLTHLFGWMTPGELRRFGLAEQADAIAWVAAD